MGKDRCLKLIVCTKEPKERQISICVGDGLILDESKMLCYRSEKHAEEEKHFISYELLLNLGFEFKEHDE